jgi:hypothetical protein
LPLFWLVGLSLGRRLALTFRLHAEDFTAFEANLVALTIGTDFLQLVPYLLASARALTASTVRLTCAFLLLMLLPEAVRVLVRARLQSGTEDDDVYRSENLERDLCCDSWHFFDPCPRIRRFRGRR